MNSRKKLESIIKMSLFGTEKGDGYEKRFQKHCKNGLITERIVRGLRIFPFHWEDLFSGRPSSFPGFVYRI